MKNGSGDHIDQLLYGQFAGDTSSELPRGETPTIAEGRPVYRNIRITNLKATAQSRRHHPRAAESPISDVVLENVEISSDTGMTVRKRQGHSAEEREGHPKAGLPFLVENSQVELAAMIALIAAR